MALDYSTPNLLAMVRDIAFFGSSQKDWPDTRLIRLLNREIEEYMVPLIMRARKNHFVTFVDVPLVGTQKLYRLPSKATGLKLRAAQLVDLNGNAVQPLKEAELEQAMNYGQSYLIGNQPLGTPQVYYFVGNQMALHPVPDSNIGATTRMRLWYLARPNTLVAPVDSGTGVVNAVQVTGTPGGAAPGNFRLSYNTGGVTWLTAGAVLDIVQNKPGFDVLGTFTVAAATGTTVDLTGTLPPDLLTGDWFCPTDTAPVITGAVPEIVIGCLIKKTTMEAVSAKGDQEGFSRLAGLLKLDENSAVQFLNRRNTGDHRATGTLAANRFKRGAMGYPW